MYYFAILLGCNKVIPKIITVASTKTQIDEYLNNIVENLNFVESWNEYMEKDTDEIYDWLNDDNIINQYYYKLNKNDFEKLYGMNNICTCKGDLIIVKATKPFDINKSIDII